MSNVLRDMALLTARKSMAENSAGGGVGPRRSGDDERQPVRREPTGARQQSSQYEWKKRGELDLRTLDWLWEASGGGARAERSSPSRTEPRHSGGGSLEEPEHPAIADKKKHLGLEEERVEPEQGGGGSSAQPGRSSTASLFQRILRMDSDDVLDLSSFEVMSSQISSAAPEDPAVPTSGQQSHERSPRAVISRDELFAALEEQIMSPRRQLLARVNVPAALNEGGEGHSVAPAAEVHVDNVAMSDAAGAGFFRCSGTQAGNLHLATPENQPSSRTAEEKEDASVCVLSHAVQSATLDDYFAAEESGSFAMVKIDAEGLDFKILRGAARLLAEKRVLFLLFEASTARNLTHFEEGVNWLRGVGYGFCYAVMPDTIFPLSEEGFYASFEDIFRSGSPSSSAPTVRAPLSGARTVGEEEEERRTTPFRAGPLFRTAFAPERGIHRAFNVICTHSPALARELFRRYTTNQRVFGMLFGRAFHGVANPRDGAQQDHERGGSYWNDRFARWFLRAGNAVERRERTYFNKELFPFSPGAWGGRSSPSSPSEGLMQLGGATHRERLKKIATALLQRQRRIPWTGLNPSQKNQEQFCAGVAPSFDSTTTQRTKEIPRVGEEGKNGEQSSVKSPAFSPLLAEAFRLIFNDVSSTPTSEHHDHDHHGGPDDHDHNADICLPAPESQFFVSFAEKILRSPPDLRAHFRIFDPGRYVFRRYLELLTVKAHGTGLSGVLAKSHGLKFLASYVIMPSIMTFGRSLDSYGTWSSKR